MAARILPKRQVARPLGQWLPLLALLLLAVARAQEVVISTSIPNDPIGSTSGLCLFGQVCRRTSPAPAKEKNSCRGSNVAAASNGQHVKATAKMKFKTLPNLHQFN